MHPSSITKLDYIMTTKKNTTGFWLVIASFWCVSCKAWNPASWRMARKPSPQIPEYFEQKTLAFTEDHLKKVAPLVFAEEIRSLQSQLALASVGKSFVYIGGDCAETFEDSNTDKVWKDFRLLLEVSLLLTFGLDMPVVKIARIAGQYAKPRSQFLETRNGTTLPAYQGDIINGRDFNTTVRAPNPLRMITAYHQSCQTLNILRAFIQGGYSRLDMFGKWRLVPEMSHSALHSTYEFMYTQIQKTLRFIRSVGLADHPRLYDVQLFTGHEALLLPYEEPLVRKDSITGDYYACSAHFLWVGERTRQLEGPHLEFARGIKNPIGLKISQEITPEELLRLTRILNPKNEHGRLTIMTRMGSEHLRANLPGLIAVLKKYDRKVVWVCDPVHANTFTMEEKKTRDFSVIWEEIKTFCEIHWENDSVVGGIHLETTGSDVTEVVGGHIQNVQNIHKNYRTVMDPRLNALQTIEICLLLLLHYNMNKKGGYSTL